MPYDRIKNNKAGDCGLRQERPPFAEKGAVRKEMKHQRNGLSRCFRAGILAPVCFAFNFSLSGKSFAIPALMGRKREKKRKGEGL